METRRMGDYLAEVMGVLRTNPTAAHLDYLVEAYARVGYLAAEAEGLAEQAEATRKHEEAQSFLSEKTSGGTVKEAEVRAMVAARPYYVAEVEAMTKARKVKNLLNSIEQAINAIKFLGRQGG